MNISNFITSFGKGVAAGTLALSLYAMPASASILDGDGVDIRVIDETPSNIFAVNNSLGAAFNSGGLDYDISFGPESIWIDVSGGSANQFIDDRIFRFLNIDWGIDGTITAIGNIQTNGFFSPNFNISHGEILTEDFVIVRANGFTLDALGNGAIHFDLLVTHIPEPSTYFLLGSSLVLVAAARKSKIKQKA